MRYDGGLSAADGVEALSVSVGAVARDCRIGKLILLRELQRDGSGPEGARPTALPCGPSSGFRIGPGDPTGKRPGPEPDHMERANLEIGERVGGL